MPALQRFKVSAVEHALTRITPSKAEDLLNQRRQEVRRNVRARQTLVLFVNATVECGRRETISWEMEAAMEAAVYRVAGSDGPADAAYVDTVLVISMVAVMLEAEDWPGLAPNDILQDMQPTELAAAAVAALAFLVSHPQYANPKKDEAVAALVPRIAQVFDGSDTLLRAEVLAPGCAAEVAHAALRVSEQGRSRSAVVATLVVPALVAQLHAAFKCAASSSDVATSHARVTGACQMIDGLSNNDLSSLDRSNMLEVLSYSATYAIEGAGMELASSAAVHEAAYRTLQQQGEALGSMAAALMCQLNRLYWAASKPVLTHKAAAHYHSLLCHIMNRQPTRLLGLLPASIAAALAAMGPVTSAALQELGPSQASEFAQHAEEAATFWLSQACDTANRALPLAACAAVLAAAAECCNEPIRRSATLQRTMDLYVAVLRRCTRLLNLPPAGSDARSQACLAAAAASMAGLVANSAMQLLNRRCTRRLGGDPALWLAQHNVLRRLTASLPQLASQYQQPSEPQQQAAEPAPRRPAMAAKRLALALPPPPQHLQSLWVRQQRQQQQDAVAAARLAQLQRDSLQAAVNALCATLGWAEAAWHGEPGNMPAALIEQLAAAASAIVVVAQQLEKHGQQRQHEEPPERDAAAKAASKRRGRQHGKKPPLLLQAPAAKRSQEPAPLAWHLRAAVTAADSVSCLVPMATQAEAVLQLAPAAPCIVHTLALLAGATNANATLVAAELLGSACHALATFAATDEAFCKALAAGNGDTSWRQACQALQTRLGEAEMQKHSEALQLVQAALAAFADGDAADDDAQALTKTQRNRAAKKAKLKQQQAEQQPAPQSADECLAAAAVKAGNARQQGEQVGKIGSPAANEQAGGGLAAAAVEAAEACREAGGVEIQN